MTEPGIDIEIDPSLKPGEWYLKKKETRIDMVDVDQAIFKIVGSLDISGAVKAEIYDDIKSLCSKVREEEREILIKDGPAPIVQFLMQNDGMFFCDDDLDGCPEIVSERITKVREALATYAHPEQEKKA